MNKPPIVVKICNGPGCRAWDAQEILRELPETLSDFEESLKVCEAACMNKCGGGVTIQVNNESKNLIKVRKPHQAIDKILPQITSPVKA